ncbi:MAG: LLM class flavin-dependent oxidoreductase, partial [Dehalococcoidia bacterium]
RVIPGLGAGWMPREFTDFGVPFLSPKERLQQLREGVELFRRMWSQDEDAVTFEGKHIRTENVVTQPKPEKQPRLLIGGSGEQVTMRIAARHADIWNNLAGQQDRIAHKVDVLRGHCDAVGRDPAEITVAQQCLVTIGKDEASVAPMIETAQKIFGGHMGNPKGELALSGTPGQVAERIQKHMDAGCTMFNIEFFGRDTREPAELFAKEVLPQFK